MSKLRFLRPLLSFFVVALLAAACSSSGGGDDELSEDEAEERIDAVLSAFADAADDEGFREDDDDDDDDDDGLSRIECEGFEAFNSNDDTIADDDYGVTDGGEPEVSVDGNRLVFDGGEIIGSVDVGVLEGDRLEEAFDAVLDDPDAFARCMEDGFSEAGGGALPGASLDATVTVEAGDTGDQEFVVTLDGVLAGVEQGLDFEIELDGEVRFIRIGSVGLVANVLTTGVGLDAGPLTGAIEVAIEEFENQFG